MLLAPLGIYRCIRPLRPEDIAILQMWDRDPDIRRLTGKKFSGRESVEQWWGDFLRDPHRIGFAIIDGQGNLIGDIALEQIARRTREAELRISIGDKRYWGRGLGTEAMRAVLEIAFCKMALAKVYLRVKPQNHRAIRAYLKTGFHKVGRLLGNGRLKGHGDVILMEIDQQTYQGWLRADSAGRGLTPVG